MLNNRKYTNINVYDAAVSRLKYIFERYDNVFVSVSGGKDSSVLFHLAHSEAKKYGKRLNVFFLDQEVEYQSTIKIIEGIMSHDDINRYWYQVPIRMTNATSYKEKFIYSWGEGEQWMREKSPLSIHTIKEDYPQRFYPLIDWFEQAQKAKGKTCFLVGLRTEESLNRYRAVIKNPGVDNINWSTETKGVIKFYPLYDWAFEDIWHYISIYKVPYNRIYDYLWMKHASINETRVSCLCHEKSFKSIVELHEFEPETYFKLIDRMHGTHTAALYAKETTIYNARSLPPKFTSWKEYRDYLLDTLPIDNKAVFEQRFGKQQDVISVHRQQVRQLLINDWENNIPVIREDEEKRVSIKEKWKNIL
jgi:predicted phosphoadenosine phosphosulfate sulfurtransferase